MRHRILAPAATGLVVAAFAPAALAAPAPAGLARPAPHCPNPPLVHLVRPGQPATVHRLTDLPPANMFLSVYRRVGGCVVPVIAGYGIGRTSRPTDAPRR